MNSLKINKAKAKLQEMCEQLDAMSKPFDPKKTMRRSLQNQVDTTSKISTDKLDEIEDKLMQLFEEPEFENYLDDFEEVCIRLIALYYKAECYEDSFLIGMLFAVLHEDLEDEVENWIEAYEDLNPFGINRLHALDCIINSLLELDDDFTPSEDQMLTLHEISDALTDQYPESWRLEVDNLRRKLDLCKVILNYEDDDDIKDLYLESCMDLVYKAHPASGIDRDSDTEEDAEKFHFINDISKDKAVVCDYLRYATTIDNLTDDELEDINNWLKSFE